MTAAAFREIVVPLDLVRPCGTVLAWSSALSRRTGVGVRLVIVASPGLDHTANVVDLQARATKVDAASVAVEVIESNDVVPALLRAAGPDGLLVVETRAHGPLTAIILGSTTNALLRATSRPVLLVGPTTEPAVRAEIMEVCLDTPEAAEALFPIAGSWARDLGLRLRFVHARRKGDRNPPGAVEELASKLALQAMERFGALADVVTLPAGAVSDAIVDDAAEVGAAIIAVGVRPRSSPLRAALGSVAIDVAHVTHAAVLAVPIGKGAERSFGPSSSTT